MNWMFAALLLFQAMQSSPLLENDFVRVFRNSAPCAAAAEPCGDRVVVALGPIGLNGKKMERGEVKVFKAGERYTPPKSGEFLEVAIHPGHPKVMPPAAGTPPPPGNKILYDGKDFTVFAEKMQPGEYAAPHSHNLRVAIFLNDTRVQQWTDGKEETRELVPDTVTWRPAVVHASKDVGTAPISNLLIEFKP
jgi:quercetin dioxygenase-like cupin family protein